ncbi:hypothetical protein [Flavobacterium sp. N2270]|uniref:DUF7677 family protein n=1 Tax=Flavobacterium sp. N2270 TaxID=2986831 RepID=UPI002224CB18|nr:hypothetical protein [Flavobacterium sp. N2270]
MELSIDFKKSLMLFVYYYTNGNLNFVIDDKTILEGIDYREELKEEATFVQTVYSVYLNNLELNHEGKVLNQSYSITRAAKYIRSICDSKYDVVPDFEDWEMETFS